jgi:hypothetical protein
MSAQRSKSSAHRIIAALGGYRTVSLTLGVRPDTVRAWFRHGIPTKFHLDIMRLARHAGIAVAHEELLETNEHGKALRRSRNRRSLDGVPPESMGRDAAKKRQSADNNSKRK